MKLYCTATGCSGILTVNVSESHSAATTTAIITCRGSTLSLGDAVSINAGYETNHDVIFTGYVKQIERSVPQNTYTITCNDYLVRAVDYFIAASNPDIPYVWTNIQAEDLVENVLALAGVYGVDSQETNFTFAVNGTRAEVQLTSAYDYCKGIADTLAWNLWCDRDAVVHFRNRKPYVMAGTSGQPGDVADTPLAGVSITNSGSSNVLDITYRVSEKDLRNRVIVYGGGNTAIHAEALEASPYLPDGFYKTVVFSHDIVDSQQMAQDTADYNLALLNRLTRQVSVTTLGDPRFQARRTVTVDETNTGLDEEAYIFSCDHNLSSAGYTCVMELRL